MKEECEEVIQRYKECIETCEKYINIAIKENDKSLKLNLEEMLNKFKRDLRKLYERLSILKGENN